ncbi:hypothetical protein ERO13_D02G182500v2 [Gossypium hirsutum]|nr:hypothetical protein ERO13_D02G182500v2 [Gossypium hirsutum]
MRNHEKKEATEISSSSKIFFSLQQTVLAMVEAAYGTINLEQHSGTHLRLGVVDDIILHPLARVSLDEAAWLAKAVATDIGSLFQVPVFLYGAAHPTGKALDSIRWELGYYRPNFMGNQLAGWTMPEILSIKPDEGPTRNVPIMSTDVSVAYRIARMVNARGGGLPTVQSLGLVHGENSIEIACMLLEPNRVGGDRVQSRVEMFAAQEGLDVETGYFTDSSLEMILDKYLNLISANRAE